MIEESTYVIKELDKISLVAKPRLLRHIHFLTKSGFSVSSSSSSSKQN